MNRIGKLPYEKVYLMELREITENVCYIPNVVNLGVIRDIDNSVILIDTGIIVAFYDKKDRYHQQATPFWAQALRPYS